MTEHALGRRVPTDWSHVEKYPLRRLQLPTVDTVERKLDINTQWRDRYNQGAEGACVGFAASLAMSILNRWFYDARWLYDTAQIVDEWADTPPSEGTSVRAAMDVLRTIGHRRRIYSAGSDPTSGASYAADLQHGILANRWARTVDELRTSIANGVPFVLGCNWYAAFDRPEVTRTWLGLGRSEYWIGRTGALGRLRGGHAICGFAASDRRQAFGLCNSWGREVYERGQLVAGYPLVWIPYDVIQRLIDEAGEATVITDRPDPREVEAL